MVDDEKPNAQKLEQHMNVIARGADRLHTRSGKLIEGVERLAEDLASYAEDEIQPGTQEDVFLRSAAIRAKQHRPHKDEYVHMLSGLILDGQIEFYHRRKNITPRRSICDSPVPYLLATEKGFETFIAEIDLSIASNDPYPGFCITGDGIEKLFSNHQNMLHTASMLANWFDRGPVLIDYDLAKFRALKYESSEKFVFSLFTSSIAEQAWHTKMMLLRNEYGGKHESAQKWEPNIEYHRVRYWQTVRDFPIGDHHDLAKLKDEARFQLQQYPGLLEGVVDSLTAASMHKPL